MNNVYIYTWIEKNYNSHNSECTFMERNAQSFEILHFIIVLYIKVKMKNNNEGINLDINSLCKET